MTTNFDHGQAQAQRSAAEKLRFILSNLHHLRKVDKKGKIKDAMKGFWSVLQRGEKLTANQMNYVDGAYEKVFTGAGYDGVGLHSDRAKGRRPKPKF